MRNIFLGTLLFFFITVLAWLFFSNNFSSDSIAVQISDEAFIPTSIKVAVGTKIVFENIGDQEHWPASNFHPTHDLYPEKGGCISSKFDACRGLKKGQKFEYVLKEIGYWPIHDHLFPVLAMRIEVVDKEDYASIKLAEKIKETCFDSSNLQTKEVTKEACYSIEFKNIGKINGPEYAFNLLTILQEIDPDTKGCHLIAHGIGAGVFERNPQDWQKQVNSINPQCNYGAIHGLLEKYVSNLPEKKLTKEIIPAICGSNPRGDCNHIIGHLVLVEAKGNVGDALELCQVFIDNYQRQFCLTGIFMEYQTALNLIEHGYVPKSWLNWSVRLDELNKMCRSYNEENAVSCWKEISHVASVKFNNDPRKLFNFCNSAQIAEGAKQCIFHGIGIVSAAKNFNFEELKTMCDIAQKNVPDFKRHCYLQLVGSFLATLPDERQKVDVFCRSLESGYQADCFQRISSVVQSIKMND